MGKHARLSPSSAERWFNCPASPDLEAGYPDTSSPAARDGTKTHNLLEKCLINAARPEQYCDEPDRCERVQVAIDYVADRIKELKESYPKAKVMLEAESKSDPGAQHGRDDWFGTCDIFITVVDENGRNVYAEAIDYKDGRSPVKVEENKQLFSYFEGKATLSEWNMRITVIQPRLDNPTLWWEPTIEEYYQLASDMVDAAKATDLPNPPMKKGDHCYFCKHKHNCIEYKGQHLAPIASSLDLTGDVRVMTDQQLASLVDAEKTIQGVLESAKQEMTKRIKDGKPVPGYKIGRGRGRKVWNCSEEEVKKRLKDLDFTDEQIYSSQLISPAQAVKINKDVEELINVEVGEGKLEKINLNDMFPNFI